MSFQSTDLDVVIQHPAGVCKVWVFGVDVGQLYRHQVMHLRQEKGDILVRMQKKYLAAGHDNTDD